MKIKKNILMLAALALMLPLGSAWAGGAAIIRAEEAAMAAEEAAMAAEKGRMAEEQIVVRAREGESIAQAREGRLVTTETEAAAARAADQAVVAKADINKAITVTLRDELKLTVEASRKAVADVKTSWESLEKAWAEVKANPRDEILIKQSSKATKEYDIAEKKARDLQSKVVAKGSEIIERVSAELKKIEAARAQQAAGRAIPKKFTFDEADIAASKQAAAREERMTQAARVAEEQIVVRARGGETVAQARDAMASMGGAEASAAAAVEETAASYRERKIKTAIGSAGAAATVAGIVAVAVEANKK